MMKRTLATSAALAALSLSAFAGGLVTNTSQSISFLRNPAQQARISVSGAYYNPAGTAFLEDGFHASFGWQMAKQTRENTVEFAPYALGKKNGGNSSKTFAAQTFAPIIPNLDLVWKKNRLSVSFHAGLAAGGGEAKFNDGISSFESVVAMLPATLQKMSAMFPQAAAIQGYDADIALTGTSYYFGGQIGVNYRILDNLSIGAGGRLVFATGSNKGSLRNIQFNVGGTYLPAAQVFQALATQTGIPGLANAAALVADRALDMSQSGLTFAPILSIDYRPFSSLNLSARYEFNSRLRLENQTKANTTGVAQYDDKLKVDSDIPALLAIGAEWSIIPGVRVDLQFNEFFDKSSKQFGDRQKLLDRNTKEILGGAEWDINRIFTVSGGVQFTKLGLGDGAYLSDTSFSTDSWSLGLGFQARLSDRLSLDFGVLKTFYKHFKKEMADYNGAGQSIFGMIQPILGLPDGQVEAFKTPGSDNFFRTSISGGIGISYRF